MGKSDVAQMPINRQDSLKLSLYISCNGAKSPSETTENLPDDMEIYANQVSGHTDNGKSMSLIKYKNMILKPVTNALCGEREINFYQQLQITTDQNLINMKEFVPKYYGTKTINFNGRTVNSIVLDDLTHNFKQPCIMDVKIGRRTWDPLAKYDKIVKEQHKYRDCKRDLGFCITGFQFYDLTTNKLVKYDKMFGKNLDKETVPEVFKAFLNANSICCRSLIVQLLACLWRIQHWARKQCNIRLYSSSLLIVYDARRLKEFTNNLNKNADQMIKSTTEPRLVRNPSNLYRPLSLAVFNNNNNINEKIPTGFSGQLTKDGPILQSPTRLSLNHHNHNVNSDNSNNNNNNGNWQKSIKTLKRTHSFQNNYDHDMQNTKHDYNSILDELSCENQSDIWATVKMIDFAHVFPAERYSVDQNYLDGIDQLVKLLEDFLIDTQ